MLPLLLLTALNAPANLVPNPRFEETGPQGLPTHWSVAAPREEVMPRLSRDAAGGRSGGAAAILTGVGERTFGAWRTTASGLRGGQWYRVGASYRPDQIAWPAHAVWLKLTWTDAADQPLRTDYVHRRDDLGDGWERTAETFQAPAKSVAVELDLMLRWTSGTVRFDEVEVTEALPPAPRQVKLAAVCWVPTGGSPASNRAGWAQKVAEAGAQGADLVVLGEGVAMVGSSLSMIECLEPVPGPTTAALAPVAKQHDLYIVAGVYEQDGDTYYNTAVLIGPQGLVGKYRKVHLPETEALAGLTPGDAYPVFETSLGRIGLQICYDDDFPEVARALALNGAEILCTPIWGDGRFNNTAWDVIPRARAMDNGLYHVAANYSQKRSLVIDPWGNLRADTAGREGLAIATVDLAERRQTPWLSSAAGASWESIWRQERRPNSYGDLTR
ncbi:MAG: carbon-nitrogen hydrolase family protein [Fimbriimonadaceae bacterium]|nr:carbon-nitrogen hydrolase family protein [Fimbriimonadaceae bacterium]